MFADNEKISANQLCRLLCLDWTAKLFLLLPVILSGLGGWEQPMAVLAGAVFAWVYAGILANLVGRMGSSFTKYMEERLGRYAARTAGLLFFVYVLLSQIYLSRATGRICRLFLLPEGKEEIPGVLFLLAGAAAAAGSVQKRARAAQCLYPVIAVMLLLMTAASAGSVKTEYLRWNTPDFTNILHGSACVFAAFAGLGLLLYEAPYLRRGKRETAHMRKAAVNDSEGHAETKRWMRKALWQTAFFMTALFVIMLGAFGKEELSVLPFPAIVLMSNVDLPGGFLQRWDIIFLSVLLLALFTASGSGIHYMERILGELFPDMKKKTRPWYAAGVSAAAMLIVGSYETAEKIFARWALCAMVPLTAALPVLLWILERVNIRYGKRRKERGT